MIDYKLGVQLEVLKEQNLSIYLGWRNDPYLYKWFRQFEPISEQAHRQWFESIHDRRDIKMYEIVKDQIAVGVCGLTDIDYINSRAEFTCYIGREFQGAGYGKSALLTLFKHGFDALNLYTIWGETYEGNPAFGLFKHIGMKHDGIRRNHYFRSGSYIDANLISISRDDLKTNLTSKGQTDTE